MNLKLFSYEVQKTSAHRVFQTKTYCYQTHKRPDRRVKTKEQGVRRRTNIDPN